MKAIMGIVWLISILNMKIGDDSSTVSATEASGYKAPRKRRGKRKQKDITKDESNIVPCPFDPCKRTFATTNAGKIAKCRHVKKCRHRFPFNEEQRKALVNARKGLREQEPSTKAKTFEGPENMAEEVLHQPAAVLKQAETSEPQLAKAKLKGASPEEEEKRSEPQRDENPFAAPLAAKDPQKILNEAGIEDIAMKIPGFNLDTMSKFLSDVMKRERLALSESVCKSFMKMDEAHEEELGDISGRYMVQVGQLRGELRRRDEQVASLTARMRILEESRKADFWRVSSLNKEELERQFKVNCLCYYVFGDVAVEEMESVMNERFRMLAQGRQEEQDLISISLGQQVLLERKLQEVRDKADKDSENWLRTARWTPMGKRMDKEDANDEDLAKRTKAEKEGMARARVEEENMIYEMVTGKRLSQELIATGSNFPVLSDIAKGRAREETNSKTLQPAPSTSAIPHNDSLASSPPSKPVDNGAHPPEEILIPPPPPSLEKAQKVCKNTRIDYYASQHKTLSDDWMERVYADTVLRQMQLRGAITMEELRVARQDVGPYPSSNVSLLFRSTPRPSSGETWDRPMEMWLKGETRASIEAKRKILREAYDGARKNCLDPHDTAMLLAGLERSMLNCHEDTWASASERSSELSDPNLFPVRSQASKPEFQIPKTGLQIRKELMAKLRAMNDAEVEKRKLAIQKSCIH